MGHNYEVRNWSPTQKVFQCTECPADYPVEEKMILHQMDIHSIQERPLVSCIMPIYGRRNFAKIALYYYLRYTYPFKELVVVDDSPEPLADIFEGLVGVRYVRLGERTPLGEKRNIACSVSAGRFIAHHDSDDWYGPGRLERQVKLLLHSGKRATVGTYVPFWNLEKQRVYVYGGPTRFTVVGATLLFERELWQKSPFVDVEGSGEDTRFMAAISGEDIWVDQKAREWFVALDHSENTENREYVPPQYNLVGLEEVTSKIQGDGEAYDREPIERRGPLVVVSAILPAEGKLEDVGKVYEGLVAEAWFLNSAGYTPHVLIAINGVKESSVATFLGKLVEVVKVPVTLVGPEEEISASGMKNIVLSWTKEADASYLFTTTDVILVPGSVVNILRLMEEDPRLVTVSAGSGRIEREVLEYVGVGETLVESLKYNYSYGMMARAVWDGNFCFEDSDAFETFGSGLEDVDFLTKLVVRGFLNRFFVKMRYFHTESCQIKGCVGEDWARRKKFLMSKWSGFSEVVSGPLKNLRKD